MTMQQQLDQLDAMPTTADEQFRLYKIAEAAAKRRATLVKTTMTLANMSYLNNGR